VNPGGTKIAIQSTKTGHGDIYTMSPTGHDVKLITSNDGVDKEPTWSPAGKSASQRYGKRIRSSSSFPRTAAARAGSSPTERETTRIRRGRPTAIEYDVKPDSARR
jgi:hypothetical protein